MLWHTKRKDLHNKFVKNVRKRGNIVHFFVNLNAIATSNQQQNNKKTITSPVLSQTPLRGVLTIFLVVRVYRKTGSLFHALVFKTGSPFHALLVSTGSLFHKSICLEHYRLFIV